MYLWNNNESYGEHEDCGRSHLFAVWFNETGLGYAGHNCMISFIGFIATFWYFEVI